MHVTWWLKVPMGRRNGFESCKPSAESFLSKIPFDILCGLVHNNGGGKYLLQVHFPHLSISLQFHSPAQSFEVTGILARDSVN